MPPIIDSRDGQLALSFAFDFVATMDKSDENDPLAPWRSAPGSQRRFERWPLNLPASVTAAGRRHRGAVRDVSPSGALVWLREGTSLSTGAHVIFAPTGYRTIPGEIRHVVDDGHLLGLMLRHGSDEQAELARWLETLRTPARRGPAKR